METDGSSNGHGGRVKRSFFRGRVQRGWRADQEEMEDWSNGDGVLLHRRVRVGQASEWTSKDDRIHGLRMNKGKPNRRQGLTVQPDAE